MDNYESEIRPALARFCGWAWDEKRIYDSVNEMRYQRTSGKECQLSRILPDPLHNPADAWALQRVLLKWCDDRGYTFEWQTETYCTIINQTACGEASWIASESADTPEAALVLAAYSVATEKPPTA